jgi:light-harvesting protein B-800-850 alpha chain
MNQKEIWCVVNPSVGLPLFLGAVAGIALIVHASVLNHTTWFAAYWNGSAGKASVGSTVTPATPVASASSGSTLIVDATDPQAALVAGATK